MYHLHLDFESFSHHNLFNCGLFKYMEKAEALILSYAIDDEPTRKIDLTKEDLPERFLKALLDPDVLKISHNAFFEMQIIEKVLHIKLKPEQWECAQVRCAYASLPLSLDNASKVLNSKMQKDPKGKKLIDYFSVPCKATKVNGGRIRNLPEHAPDKWQQFIDYCGTDTDAERENYNSLSFLRIPEFERRLWALDYKINSRGIRVDQRLINAAIQLNKDYREKLLAEAERITGMTNANSPDQIKAWLLEETDEEIKSLNKDEIPKLLDRFDSKKVKRVLELRQALSRTSIGKYSKMLQVLCRDGRIRGIVQFGGATRTHRWAGRGVQVHNLAKSKVTNWELNHVRELVLAENERDITFYYGSVSNMLSQLVRTAFIPAKGKYFIVSDFAAIEARVLAWLAGEKWRLEVFESGQDIYKASVSRMLRKPIEEVTKDERDRIGKISELALGFGGGAGALIKMDKKKQLGPKEHEPIKTQWRRESPNIVAFWKLMQQSALACIKTGAKVYCQFGITFECRKGHMFIRLPSGRELCYWNVGTRPGEYGDEIVYWEVGENNKWGRVKTYGGKLTENIVQAVARDCLANALVNLDAAGYSIVLHVHDEIVCEEPIGTGSLEEVNAIMCKKATWMKNLPLKSAGFTGNYYKKDND
jgi:DNA polymerase bacteriophage-type